METKIVKQNSELGQLGLSALVHKGFAGPNYSLDDLDISVTKNLDSLEISFYDMSCTLNSKDKNYNEILRYF
ncbi:MAG: hypothetical protein M1416_03195 [Candidatus Pacearchaeota archaeon]|nr:hypothetical protein [Candidatus Pacearchaeota archaeon]